MKTKTITATSASGVETWKPFTDKRLIELAQDLHLQWLIDRGHDPDKIDLDTALEALTHDYISYTVSEGET